MKLLRAPSPPPALLFVVAALQLPLLVVFFLLLGSSFLLQPGISVTVPDSPFVLQPRRDPKVVSIPPPPSTTLYFDGSRMDIAGFSTALDSLRGRPHTIIVRADRLAVYDRVLEAMNAALERGFPVVLATGEVPTPP